MQLVTDLTSKLEKKVMELPFQLKIVFALETALNAEKPEVLTLQERLEGFDEDYECATRSQICSLTGIALHKEERTPRT